MTLIDLAVPATHVTARWIRPIVDKDGLRFAVTYNSLQQRSADYHVKQAMKILNCLALVALVMAPTAAASEVVSHCAKSERTYFNCAVKGGKVLSLCGTPTKSGAITARRYAFGASGLVELAYPDRDAGLFLYSDYARYMTEYREVGFATSGYKYIVFARYIGDSSPGPTYGVEVAAPNGKGWQIPCTGTVVDRIAEFGRDLPCDSDSALGCRK